MQQKLAQRITQIPSSVWTRISQIDEIKGRWIAGVQLSPQVLNRLRHTVLVTSTGASTRIEGARLSDDEVERLMRGISMQKFSDRDQQEVQGYYEVLQNVFEAHDTIRITESAIKHLHRELLKYVEKDGTHRGDYKKKENRVKMIDAAGKSVATLFETTPAYLTPKQMQELVEWTQSALRDVAMHPLVVTANFIVEFLQIHPFEDGNGRLSRVLTNLFMLQQGYAYVPYVSHEKLIEDNKADYYMALRQSQKTFGKKREDITPWMEFFTTVLLSQAQTAVGLLSGQSVENLLSAKQLEVWSYLKSVREASAGEIADKTQVARPTVNQALEKLLKLKKVERLGLGRATRYQAL